VLSILISQGFAADPETGIISQVKYKYFHNLIQMPIVLLIFLAGVIGVLYGIGLTLLKHSTQGVWFTSPGTVLAVFAVFMLAGFNGTSFYPSTYDLQSSLTIWNASSSEFTLKTAIYKKEGQFYLRSSAVLHILKDLGGTWKILYVFIIIPPFIRDFVYRLIAHNRYRFFGKRESCQI
jgi:hypothetical protein